MWEGMGEKRIMTSKPHETKKPNIKTVKEEIMVKSLKSCGRVRKQWPKF